MAKTSYKTLASTTRGHRNTDSPRFCRPEIGNLSPAVPTMLSCNQSTVYLPLCSVGGETEGSAKEYICSRRDKGSCQKPVSMDWLAPISQPKASRCIHEIVLALNDLMNVYIKFPVSNQDRNKTKMGFYSKYGIPGVLGCIDGTLVAILAPRKHPTEPAFFSRKGYHAINAAIICDSDLKIVGIYSRFGGAAHDSFLLNSRSLSRHLEEQSNNGTTGWLLGDSGYPQKPWLMTPVLNTTESTPEAHYTNMHVRTQVCVEQCIGLLKARWRCLLRNLVLHYKPTKCAKIMNACAVLHNICLNDGVEIDVPNDIVRSNDESESMRTDSFDGNVARQQLISALWENRP